MIVFWIFLPWVRLLSTLPFWRLQGMGGPAVPLGPRIGVSGSVIAIPKIPGWECQCAAHTAHPSRTKSMGRVRAWRSMSYSEKDREGGRLWIRRGHSLSTCCYVARHFHDLLIHRNYFWTLMRFDRLYNKLALWVSGEWEREWGKGAVGESFLSFNLSFKNKMFACVSGYKD